MAEPEVQGPLTDTELSALVGKIKQLKPEDIDALTDDEIRRLDRLMQPNPPAKDPTYINPLAGKPTIAEFERNKRVAETPRMGLPTYPGVTPPMPQEGPKDLHSFLNAIATAAGVGANRPPPEPEAPAQRVPAGEHEMSNPLAVAQRVRAQQDQLIGANQPMRLLYGAGPSDPATNDAIAKIVPQILVETVASFSEFVANPAKQLRERPIEFGGNAIQAAVWLRAGSALKQLPNAVERTKAAIRAMPPEEIAGATAALETKLDEISQAKNLNRTTTQDPEITQRLRDLEARVTQMRNDIKANAAPAPKAVEIPEPLVVEAPTAAPVISDAAKATTKLPTALAATPMGGMILAGAAQDDQQDPTPRAGSPLSAKHPIWTAAAVAGGAGILGYGAFRYFRRVEFAKALAEAKVFTRLDKSKTADLERFAEIVMAPLFPDTPANQSIPKVIGGATIAGTLAGAAVGSKMGRDEVSPTGAVLGAISGAFMGSVFGNSLAKMFATEKTYRTLYKEWFKEGGLLPEGIVSEQTRRRISLEGRVREIKDVVRQSQKFDAATREQMQAYMSGQLAPGILPAEAQDIADHMRLIFDEHSMDLLSLGLIKDGVLKDKIVANIGTYSPRLYLRYELDNGPTERVAQWLRSHDEAWGRFSKQDYLKHRGDIPEDVRKAWGEIKDNPGYLLAKRGVVTAADIEHARYQRFILSSPEFSIPEAAMTGEAAPKLFYNESGAPSALWEGRTYWKMPENKRWGILSGRYVEAAVASDMMGIHETASGLAGLLDAGTSAFKFFKAVFNPASQLRNNIANVILADLEAGIGFGPWNWAKWYRGFKDLKTGSDWYKRARRAGAFGGEFTKAEMLSYLEPGMEGSASVMEHIGKNVPHWAQKLADAGPETFAKWHQASEAWARQTVFRHAVESMGMDDVAAAAFARKTIPDYQDVPRWVKVVRKSPFGAPFISFSYKALPRTLEAAVAFGNPKKMMGFWKYPLAFAALNEYAAQKFGLLGKDEKTDVFSTVRRMTYRTLSAGLYQPEAYDTFRKYLPGHVGKMQITVPWRDQFDRPQYLDGTYFLPWGDAGEMGKGDVGKNFGVPFLPRQLEPSNPWFQLGVAATTGKDSFTGKDIIPAGSTGPEHIAALGQFLMRSWGPSLAPGAGYGAQSLERSFSGAYEGSPDVKDEMTAIAADILGARQRPVDPASSYKFKYFEAKKDLDAIRSEIISSIRALPSDTELTPEVIASIRANKPSARVSRALDRYERRAKQLLKEYPSDEVPPSPEKLIEAIQNRGKK